MKRRSDEEWRELLAKQAASGKTAEAFCRLRGLNAKYFSKRHRRFLAKRGELSVQPKPSAFLAARVAAQAIRLYLPSGVELELPGPVSAQWVADFVGALGG